ncbi:uroporphyrinogen-III synthase [Brachybacterium hainanense]|uniref:Uroporphyrinogen-III synthase n=1 Tax=Brachybacterium hainanense TaxID=1541174 RepID=A0ABV6RFA2_9MICO
MSIPPGRSPAGRPVLVTRPAGRGDALLAQLRDRGIAAEHRPFTRLVPQEGSSLRADLEELAAGSFTHLVLTSRTAVDVLLSVRAEDGRSLLHVPASTAVVAVGTGTAAQLEAAGLAARLVAGGSGAALVEAMPPARPGDRVLFPASSAASRTVPEGLAGKGYAVREVVAYRPCPVPPGPDLARRLRDGAYAAIVLTSPMIARLAAALGIPPTTAVVTIGAPTTRAARAAGMTVRIQAAAPSDAALADAVLAVLSPPGASAPRT